MSQSLTTVVDIDINRAQLDKKFALYEVTYTRSEKQRGYAYKLSQIEKHANPLGLISHSRAYWILLKAEAPQPKSTPDIAYKKQSFVDRDDLLIARLLTRALGRLAMEGVFSGLGETFVFLDTDTYKKQTIYKCLNIDLRESARSKSLFINMDGVVFCPKDIAFMKPSLIEQASTFSFNKKAALLNRDKQGTLIKHSPGKGHFTSSAIDISKQQPLSLQKSRTGALHRYLTLMNSTFESGFSIKLRKISADWRLHYGNKEIKQVYDKIYDVINNAGGIQVLNISQSSQGFECLKEATWPVKVHFVESEAIASNIPLLLILDSKEEYDKAGVVDPKSKYYGSNKVTQSIYNKTIVNKNRRTVSTLVDTSIKEMAIKLECLKGKFLIQEFNDEYWFVRVEQQKQKDEPKFHILKCSNGNISYECHNEFYFEDIGIELPEKKQFFESIHYVIDMSANPSVVCSIVHEGIAAVPDGEPLFKVLNQLQRNSHEGMTRKYIQDFACDSPLNQKLKTLLDTYPNKTEFFKDELKQFGVGYKTNDEKQLFDEYFEATGVMLNYSLKGQHNEYLESQTGHFYDANSSSYFVGMPKGGFKFSRGQFNHLRYLDGPDYLKKRCVELTASYFVRNKHATVLPFPFKVLNEFVQLKKAT